MPPRLDVGSYYVRDKTLGAGEGHGALSHRSATLTLVLDGTLEEGFEIGPLCSWPWTLMFKPEGIVHTTSGGATGVRMWILGYRTSEALAKHGLHQVREPTVWTSPALCARFLSMLLATAFRQAAPQLSVPLQDWSALRYRSPNEPEWMAHARRRILDRPADAHLSALAAETGVHPGSIARAFKTRYGVSAGRMRSERRMDLAVRRLLAGHESLADIAQGLGYADQSHFTREFVASVGLPPGRFRRIAANPPALISPAQERRASSIA